MFELVLDYGEHHPQEPGPGEIAPWAVRADPFSSYRSGFEIRFYRLCPRALLFHRFPELGEVPLPVRALELQYAEDAAFTHLTAAVQRGFNRNAQGTLESRAFPPLSFAYSEADLDGTVREVDPESLENLPSGLRGNGYRWTDLHGEGIAGILYQEPGAWPATAGRTLPGWEVRTWGISNSRKGPGRLSAAWSPTPASTGRMRTCTWWIWTGTAGPMC